MTRITRTDVAHYARVSKATVSYVLNDQADSRRISRATAERVLTAVRTLAYLPRHHAQAINNQRNRSIALILDSMISRPGDRACLLGASQQARARGWYVLPVALPASECDSWLASGRCEAAICRPMPQQVLPDAALPILGTGGSRGIRIDRDAALQALLGRLQDTTADRIDVVGIDDDPWMIAADELAAQLRAAGHDCRLLDRPARDPAPVVIARGDDHLHACRMSMPAGTQLYGCDILHPACCRQPCIEHAAFALGAAAVDTIVDCWQTDEPHTALLDTLVEVVPALREPTTVS